MNKISISVEEQFDYDLLKILLNRLNIKFEVTQTNQDNNTSDHFDELITQPNQVIFEDIETKFVNKNTNSTFSFEFSEETISNVLQTIEIIQKNYFATGLEKFIVPMILDDVAKIIQKDLSTVSRIIESKTYVKNGKIFYYKDLFNSHDFSTIDGRPVSRFEILDIIINLIAEEDKYKPLTDDAIVEELLKLKYNIKRRTIVKYRELKSIPSSFDRRIK